MTNGMARQGDLLFRAIDHLPEGLTLLSDNVIIRGEATGHEHRLQTGRVLQDAHGMLFLEVPTATQVVHQEHRPIHLERGVYRVT